MGKTIIPVGKTLGPYQEGGVLKYVDHHLGQRVEHLTVDEAMIWSCAHAEPQVHSERRFGRDDLNNVIAKENKNMFNHDRDKAIAKLFEVGALIEVDFENDSVETFLSKYRLIPTGQGFGNAGDRAPLFGIGKYDQPEVFVKMDGYFMWAGSYLQGSIWAGCKDFAENADGVSMEKVVSELTDVLPVIVAVDAGYLEPLS